MDPQQIKAFIDAMAASDLDEMEVSHDGWTLRLVRRTRSLPGTVIPAEAGIQSVPSDLSNALDPHVRLGSSRGDDGCSSDDERLLTVQAPMFGVVHLQQAPGEPPFVKPGDVIEAGQMLCTIEAMKVFNEVRADRTGRVAAVLVTSGTEVEAGQPLLTLERVEHV